MAVDQVALAWVLAHPTRPVPVLGTGDRDRLRAAAGAAGLTLDREAWFTLLEASIGEPVP